MLPSTGMQCYLILIWYSAVVILGWKPRRTLVFAHWDGEEQGLMGSTEFVEVNVMITITAVIAMIIMMIMMALITMIIMIIMITMIDFIDFILLPNRQAPLSATVNHL